ncbi:MAG: hypothetical protein QOK05_139 [Chloroflexota bacterium]|jgi:hypothetical protein|nr:hypothetical protein [Chloroflexota bacterium]
MNEQRLRAIRGILLAVQGALIILGGALQFVSSPLTLRLDQFSATDITMASIAFGAGMILAFRGAHRTWVNLAILYNALAIIAWAYNYFSNSGNRLTPTVGAVSLVFLIGLGLTYPRGADRNFTENSPAV